MTVCLSLIYAEEGMWLMSQINDLDLSDKGFKITADSIYQTGKPGLYNAIVWLGGCSASFVSPDGLLLTNHHCAYAGLHRASALDSVDYIRDGFIAANQGEELPAPGQFAYVLTAIDDVTKDVLKAARYAGDLTEREKLMDKKCTQIVEETEADRDDIHCEVVKLFEGSEYRKYVFTKYQDVRIVYAPPAAIGKYGGDTDNWMWPRHTGDFTFLRVYQGPDGTAAKYAPENIPLSTPVWLKVAQQDLSDGDPAFIIGFPGTTTRYRTANDVEYTLHKHYIPMIKKYRDLLDIMDKVTLDDPESAIRLANLNAGINNVMKKYQGNVDGMLGTHFIENKRREEEEIERYVNADKKRFKRYGDIFEGMSELTGEREAFHASDEILDAFGYYSGILYYLADYAYEVARERAKPEADRDPDFSEKRIREFVEQLPNRYLGYVEAYDKAALTYTLEHARSAPAGFNYFQLPENPAAWVESAYRGTKLKDVAYMQRLFGMRASQIEELSDPLVRMAVSLYAPKFEKKERLRNWNARMNDLRMRYIELLRSYRGTPLYPDATGTIRFTYGTVKGYTPRDAVWYKPFTTLSGVIAKHTGEEPFNAPDALIAACRQGDTGNWTDPELGDVPSCFLMTGDITGGNSGSAVMNRNGELIGLAFDGNYEAMTSDWMFLEEIQRTIAVDIRYVLFITQKVAKAQWILDEMKIGL
ncbi:MAG: S46 family peptidase [Candidatus Marinimicrobia bacterium]|nr:S46 family peptidase [Candidatus Neomarinimicrobiota bacterium]